MDKHCKDDEACFNLVTQPWIPVLWHDGRCERVGIHRALTEAGHIRQIAAANPMDRVALLRFLLAVLYWCKGNPSDGDQERLTAGVPSQWLEKLEAEKDRFNLLGEGKRFYQNPAYAGQRPQHTTNYLIQEVPSGSNHWHFRHATDFDDGLCPACCAMGFVRLPVFTTGGGRGLSAATGKSPGINSKPPLYVLPVGPNLAATLLLLWQPSDGALGTPEWEKPVQILPKTGPVPLLVGLTWPPRSIWLAAPEATDAPCSLCGQIKPLIRRCVFDGKGSAKSERQWRDPHVVYEAPKDGAVGSLQTTNALDRSDAAAGQWAFSLAQILRARVVWAKASALSVVGFATVKNDKYLEASEFNLPLPLPDSDEVSLPDRLQRWHEAAGGLTKDVQRVLSKDVQRVAPAGSRDFVQVRPAVDGIRADAEHRASRDPARFLASGNGDVPRAVDEYRRMVPVATRPLAPGFTTRAVQRRNRLAQVVPDTSSRPAAKVRKPKKGGEQ